MEPVGSLLGADARPQPPCVTVWLPSKRTQGPAFVILFRGVCFLR